MFEVLDLATNQALCAMLPVIKVRSGFLICCWKGKGKGWRTCTLVVLKYTQSLKPELGGGYQGGL